MRDTARWAFWRRFWYGTGFGTFWLLVFVGVYFSYFHVGPTCFDGGQNGLERGVDCGGVCVRICAVDVIAPKVLWSQSFRVTEGQYNAVAYVENQNPSAATPEVEYIFSLYDNEGLITEKKGATLLPPDSVYPIFIGRVDTGGRVPTKTFLELGEAPLWLPAEKGRDQFTVEDRELFDVDARPRLEASIRNNELTPARDVEIVATIFDARRNALTSSRTFVEYFAPQTSEDVVFTWPEPIAKTLRSCEVPTDVVVAIDVSGSMNNDGGTPPEPISSVISAADSFVSRLNSNDQSALVTFATDAALVTPFGSGNGAVQQKIKAIAIAPEEETGSTNTGDAFVLAKEELMSARHNQNARKVMVILTDGLATSPDEDGADPAVYAREKAAALKAEGVEVYAIGLGNEVNMEFVRQIASNQTYAFQALSSSQVDAIYKQITGAICEDGAAVIEIIPKTDASFEELK